MKEVADKKNNVEEKLSPDVNDEKLNSIFELTMAINMNVSAKELLLIYRNVLLNNLKIGRILLLGHDAGWNCLLSIGINAGSLEFTIERAKSYVHVREITQVGKDAWVENEDFDILIPVYHKDKPLAYVFLGDLKHGPANDSALKHLPYIQTLTNILMVAIENKKLVKENIHQTLLSHEMDLARKIQSILVPGILPHTDELDIDAYYLPYQQISGDYYDYIPLGENDFAICIADVSGKGVAAALLMSNFQASLHALIVHSSSLTDLVTRLNKNVIETAKGESYITFFIAKFNRLTQCLNYVNAGHYPPILYMENMVTMLKSGGPALGMIADMPYLKEGIISISTPANILAYTDGITELEDEQNEEYSVERLSDLFVNLASSGVSSNTINENITESLKIFKGKEPYLDDITLLCCRILKRNQLPLFH